MDGTKLAFITSGLIKSLEELPADAQRKWGKMNAQQMVEHVAGFFRVSTGKILFPLVTSPEHLPKYKEFLRSDKEFRENTRAPVLPEEPLPVRFNSIEAALENLDEEIRDFLFRFDSTPGLITRHPVFGDLDFEEWILLHYKHVVHHLKQFGIIIIL